jgi:nitrite reductase (NO-forming)/hydroxylamine reductase
MRSSRRQNPSHALTRFRSLKVITTGGNNPQGEFVQSRVCIMSDVSPDKVGPYFILALKEAGQMWRIDWSQPDFPIDGKFVYVADCQGNVVRVYDAETFEKVAEVGGVTMPTGIFNTSRRDETLGH